MKKKILILGHGRHGKDTVGLILMEQRGYRVCSSSFFAAGRVMMPYFESIGRPYESVLECFNDRHTGNNRSVWFDQISAYNSPDKSKLPGEVLEESDIYVGMRCPEELAASRHLFDVVLWVDRSEYEPQEPHSSMGIDYDPDTMILIDNNYSVDHLEEAVMSVFDIIEKVV